MKYFNTHFSKLILLNIILFIGTLSIVKAEHPKIYIKLTVGECLTCYGEPLITNKLINDNAHITIITQNYNKSAIYKYLSSQYPIPVTKVKLIVSDSIYNVFNNHYFSELFVIKEKTVVFSCLMKDLSKNIPYIEFLLEDFPEKIKLPDKADIIYAGNIYYINNYFYLFDPFLSVIYKINKKGKLLKSINKDYFNFDTLFMKIINDEQKLKRFKKFGSTLKKIGRGTIKIQSIFVNDSSLFIDLIVPVVYEKGDTVKISGKEAIIHFNSNVDNNEYDYYTFDKKSIPDNYYPATYSSFFQLENSNVFKILMIKEKIDSAPNYFLGNFIVQKNRLVFESFDSIVLPEFFVKNKVYYDFISPVIQHNNYIILNNSNVIFDLTDKSKIETPFKNTAFVGDKEKYMLKTNNYFLNDFLFKDNTFYYIYYDNNENKYFFQKTGITFNIKKEIPEISKFGRIKSNLYFYNSNVLFFLSSNNELVFLKL